MKLKFEIVCLFLLMNTFSYNFAQDTLAFKLSADIHDEYNVKAYDKIHSDTKFQLYIKSNIQTYLYVVKSDNINSKLIKFEKIGPKILQEIKFNLVDNTTKEAPKNQNLTIVLFREKKELINEIFSEGPVLIEKWEVIENNYVKNSIFSLLGNTEIPRIAGNMRGKSDIELKNYLMDNYFIKKFRFYVKR